MRIHSSAIVLGLLLALASGQGEGDEFRLVFRALNISAAEASEFEEQAKEIVQSTSGNDTPFRAEYNVSADAAIGGQNFAFARTEINNVSNDAIAEKLRQMEGIANVISVDKDVNAESATISAQVASRNATLVEQFAGAPESDPLVKAAFRALAESSELVDSNTDLEQGLNTLESAGLSIDRPERKVNAGALTDSDSAPDVIALEASEVEKRLRNNGVESVQSVTFDGGSEEGEDEDESNGGDDSSGNPFTSFLSALFAPLLVLASSIRLQ